MNNKLLSKKTKIIFFHFVQMLYKRKIKRENEKKRKRKKENEKKE